MGFADGLEIECAGEVLNIILRGFCFLFLSDWENGVLFADMGF